MRQYERYLGREIYAASFLVLAAFLGLFAFLDLINEMKDVGREGYRLHHAIAYVALTLPGLAYDLLPIAVLIGTMYSLTLLSHHSEITVLRASGLSTATLLASLAKIGAVFVVLTFVIGEFVTPPAESAAKTLRLTATGEMIGQEFRSGLWVKDGRSFINVREVLPDGSLRGIRVFSFDAGHRLLAVSEAARGSYLPSGRWKLEDVAQTVMTGEPGSVRMKESMEWESALNPGILSVLLVVPERMSLLGLYRYIDHMRGNQQATQRYEIALWRKIVYPFAVLVMMVLALPFAYSHNRMTAVSAKVFAGVMIGIGFHMLNGLFSHLGVINHWSPPISAMAPGIMFLSAAAVMLWWVERR